MSSTFGAVGDKIAESAKVLADTSLTAEQKVEKLSALIQGSTSTPSTSNGAVAESVMSVEEQMELITSNLQEVLDQDIMEKAIKEGRPLRIYWGTATTGRPHCGYFVGMMKIASYLRAGCHVKILLADIHAFLDNLKAPIELVNYRAEYYKYCIVELLRAVGVSTDRLEFVLGSSYQLSKEYQMDLLRLCTIVTMHDAKKAGAEVVKQVENATLSGLIYPLMQALDEQYLDVDAQTGGVDQRKIFTLAKDVLPKLGYKERAHLMNPMVPGLAGGKMSASDPNSKIDILDDAATVTSKIKKAFALPKEVEGNGLISFIEYVLLPASSLQTGGEAKFVVERREGGALVYGNIQKIQEDYQADVLNPQNLKPAVTKALNELLAPVQAAYKASPHWQEITEKAYPPPPPPEKKVKKMKNKGTRAPGAGGAEEGSVEAQPDGSVEGTAKEQVDLGDDAAAALKQLELEKKVVGKS